MMTIKAPSITTVPTAPTTTTTRSPFPTTTSSIRFPGFGFFGEDAAPPDAEVPGTEDAPPPGVQVQAPIEAGVTPPPTPAPTPSGEVSIWKKWWFWAAVGGGVAVVGGGAWYFTRKGKSQPVQGLRDWEEDVAMRRGIRAQYRFSMVDDGIRFDTAAIDDRTYFRDPRWKQRWEFDLKQEIRKFKAGKPTKLVKMSEIHYRLPGIL
jgi:hypothetical protein